MGKITLIIISLSTITTLIEHSLEADQQMVLETQLELKEVDSRILLKYIALLIKYYMNHLKSKIML